MNNAQLAANGMAPLPASIDTALKLYSDTWTAYQSAEKMLEAEGQHPDNFNGRGQLTQRGARLIRKLFAHGLKDSDIADLMDMDQSSVFRRRKEWAS
jgi:DNA-binding NarL/FixJ family response regulator